MGAQPASGRRVIPTISAPRPSSTRPIAKADPVVLLPVEGSCTGPVVVGAADATAVVVVVPGSVVVGPPEATELLGATDVVVVAAVVVGAIVVVAAVVVGAIVVVVTSVVVVVSQYGYSSHSGGTHSGSSDGIE